MLLVLEEEERGGGEAHSHLAFAFSFPELSLYVVHAHGGPQKKSENSRLAPISDTAQLTPLTHHAYDYDSDYDVAPYKKTF